MILAHRSDLAASEAPLSTSTLREREVEAKREILEQAIEEHFETLLGWVVRLLRRWNVFERSQARSPGDIAGDVLADACVAVLRQAERFEAERDPIPWILGFAVNAAKRERERVFKANRAASERPEVIACDLAPEDQSGQDALEEHAARLALSLGLLHSRRSTALETEQALQSLLAPLSEDDRQVIVLSVFEGYDSPRLAQILGTSAPAARKRLQRALDRLRTHIRDRREHFDWIEDLPELLELRPEMNGSRSTATPPCHSNGASGQHAQSNLASAHRDSHALPSSGTKSLATSHGGENSTANIADAKPEPARLPRQADANRDRGGEPWP